MSFTPFGAYRPSAAQKPLIAIGNRLPLNYMGRRIASVLRSYLSRTAVTPLDLVVLGQRMRLHPWDNACEKRLAVAPQFFDPEELAFLKTRLAPNFRFVDVGSNIGTYSIFVATNAPKDARVLALDPNQLVLDRLKFNAAANDLTNVMTRCIAIGDDNRVVQLRVGQSNMGGSSVLEDHDMRQSATIVDVEMRTLASVIDDAGFTHIDAMKIDIEGLEDRALVPFLRTSPRHLLPKALIIERNPDDWQVDVIAVAQSLGYQLTSGGRGNAILKLATT